MRASLSSTTGALLQQDPASNLSQSRASPCPSQIGRKQHTRTRARKRRESIAQQQGKTHWRTDPPSQSSLV
eukprot:114285-Rhodomonas_salina.1